MVLVVGEIKKKYFLGLTRKALVFLTLSLAIGPGLLVNATFKDHWGRARPMQIVEFGGTQKFTPAFVITDQCARNCSFTSGHASAGFYLFSFAFLLRRRRAIAIVSAGALGGLIGLGRIAQGSHFLSDVIFSGFAVYAVAWLLYHMIFQEKHSEESIT